MVTSDTTAEDRGTMYANSGNIEFPEARATEKYIDKRKKSC